ncbi:xanthine dehydrogenase molybdopterin binding subunit [Zavarzinia compransoris]|uniref:Xanthine dehydrogenase molybdopterin binding subunit n=1 Tax=Zavarzinia compransoris TaxID=1264899 RepID=A0A317EAZ5_9PROT|nr:xanthine dehydrogenase molybdopterin binding subunit [Zavarzinia compransoris]PWR23454.1 xanthine dehydrogenase molybdopterin binding subunit [Zavarzinia compransoris]TDP45966.1 xanthine dehydrogenase molybdenum binding subunit apoprotein [Zavarzinia compransoris]
MSAHDPAVHRSTPHESAARHVTGSAPYIDDLPEPKGLLHLAFGLADRAHARIVSLDLDAVRAAPGVVLVLTAADMPPDADLSPVHAHDEPILAGETVEFHGHPIFIVAAETRDAARRAARLGKVAYEDLPAAIDIEAARQTGRMVTAPMVLARGEAAPAIAAAPHVIEGRVVVGGQEHFYLESQIAMAIPGEADEVRVYSSTQHPSEIQHMVAHVLHLPLHAVTVEMRRMGGGFGGKETSGNIFAVVAALVATRTGRPAKFRPDRDDDMVVTGKRHDFAVDYKVGFDDAGVVLGIEGTFAARCGYSADLSGPITDRALFHADNTYYYPAVRFNSLPLKTNTVSNVAFRGFGGPQGVVMAERVMDEIAYHLGLDPLEVRKRNLYGHDTRNVTPYHQVVEDNVAPALIAALEERSDYGARRAAIRAANAKNPVIRRGIAITPVKFGISFTATHYNQAGALVHVYTDGSVMLNHGGTEMGQGLHVKVAQVVAAEFGLDVSAVRITATDTSKVPNTSATAASSGSDLNGMAAQAAARQIRERLTAFAAERWQVSADQVRFAAGMVQIGAESLSFAEFARRAYGARIQLSASGFYKTPKIHWDRASGKGKPFYYYAYGAACSEVAVDTLTGEYRVLRVDILHDVGKSLNPAIDIGQIEGGFIQGMGWLTTEELWWDGRGRLRTHAPSTYKIPACGDRPLHFEVALFDNENAEPTVFRSKAVGEPPFMLGFSVLHALSDAVASVADYRLCPRLDAPATPERVLAALEALQARAIP